MDEAFRKMIDHIGCLVRSESFLCCKALPVLQPQHFPKGHPLKEAWYESLPQCKSTDDPGYAAWLQEQLEARGCAKAHTQVVRTRQNNAATKKDKDASSADALFGGL